ncbi:MAG: ABC transporter ATP-binding protein [Pseudomonadaceae bacterium]|nr:ABC transporter ATP-binding protein [Pseudomonadaceae bacterium]
MIEARNLVRRYGNFKAVDDVSFSIEPGEVVGLLGHNGAGKTTIMKMLTGFLEPCAGQTLVDGIDVFAAPDLVQAKMGYLPESSPLYPELTVVEYLSYAAQLRGLQPAQCVPQAIEATQLQSRVMDRIDTLSRGYKQRVGVAQAILHAPKFVILDEPSNGLDPTQTQHMRELIRHLARDATVILSTHIMQEVKAVCDRVLILRAGQLALDERLQDLQQASAVQLKTDAHADVKQLLGGLAVTAGIVPESAGHWRIELNGDLDAGVSALATTLVQAGVPVYSLVPAAQDLESIFKQVSEATPQEVSDAA